MLNRAFDNDTICAISTPHGMGAIALIRVSGNQAFDAVTSVFQRNGKKMPIEDIISHKAFYGHIIYKGEMLDEVLVTFFKSPHSFTGEDSAEISVHGSVYIQQNGRNQCAWLSVCATTPPTGVDRPRLSYG